MAKKISDAELMVNYRTALAASCNFNLSLDERNAAKYVMRRTRRMINDRRRDQIMRDCGLVKVRGPVTGRTYWE